VSAHTALEEVFVKHFMQSLWLTAAAGLLLLAPAAIAQAQDVKPVAVVSIAPVDKILGDVDYLSKAAGQADAGRLATLIAGPYIDGLDRTKPSGAFVTLDGETPIAVGFVATKDLTRVLATLKDSVGEPKDVGDGVQQLGDSQVFLKLVGGYTFVAQDAAHLAKLPKDPAALLGGLEKTYTFAGRFSLKDVPRAMKDKWIDELKQGFESAPVEIDDPAQREIAEKTARNAIEQIVAFINESNDITLGWAVDPVAKSTYIDVIFTAQDGTKLAKRMAALKEAKTDFAGFLLPGAAFTAISTHQADAEEVGQTLALLDGLRGQFMKEIEKEELDKDELDATKEMVNAFIDSLSATVKTGKLDGGAVVLAEPKALTVVAGGHIADAAKLEDALKKGVAFMQKKHPDELKDAEIKFDVAKYGGLRFHSVKYTVDDEEVKKVFGEKLDVIVAAGDKALYVAFGAKAESTLKEVIDKSAASPGKAVQPMQMTVSIGPIIKLVDSIDPNPITAALKTAADKVKGNDRIQMNVKAVSNGEQIRFEIEEGVLQVIGEAAKSAQGGGAF
jgi:hypothetical protein